MSSYHKERRRPATFARPYRTATAYRTATKRPARGRQAQSLGTRRARPAKSATSLMPVPAANPSPPAGNPSGAADRLRS